MNFFSLKVNLEEIPDRYTRSLSLNSREMAESLVFLPTCAERELRQFSLAPKTPKLIKTAM